MSAVIVDGYEYTAYGPGVIRRAVPDGAWEAVAPEDVPERYTEEQTRIKVRDETKQDPWRPEPGPGEPAGTGRRVSGVIRPNPALEAAAEKLGLSPQEFRKGLNSHDATFTRKRLPEEEFDALMAQFGLDPVEARARFRGEFEDVKAAPPLI